MEGYNDTKPCTHPYLIDLARSPDDVDSEWVQRFADEFFKSIASETKVKSTRYDNFELINREVSMSEVTSQILDFATNDEFGNNNGAMKR